MQVPFRAHMRGTVVDVVRGDFTRSGEAKATFALVDSAGAWVQCCAVGARNAGSKPLQEGFEVVVYNVSARASLQQGQSHCVWLFKDAFVVPVAVARNPLKKLLKVELQSPSP